MGGKPQLNSAAWGAFPRVRVQRGDTTVMAYQIECCECTRTEELVFSTGGPTHDPERVASRFRTNGWTVPRSRHKAVCPRCNGTVKPKREREETMASIADPKPRSTLTAIKGPDSPDFTPQLKPLTMASQLERRGIMNALVESYDTNGLRYRQDWSDERIVSMLGLPQHWVAEVREQFFGPDRSEADKAREATIAKIATALEELETRHLKHGEQIDSLRKSLDALKAGF